MTTHSGTFIEMKSKDIRPLKEKIWKQNDEMCPVLKKKIPLDKMALDHAHKRNDEEYCIRYSVCLNWPLPPTHIF